MSSINTGILAESAVVALFVLCGCTGGTNKVSSTTPDSTQSQSRPSPSNEDTPAPGTARVRLTVDSCTEEAEEATCTVIVKEVLGYGMATPPLDSSQPVGILVPSRYAPGEGNDTESLEPENEYIALLRSTKNPPLPPEQTHPDQPEWELIVIVR